MKKRKHSTPNNKNRYQKLGLGTTHTICVAIQIIISNPNLQQPIADRFHIHMKHQQYSVISSSVLRLVAIFL